MTCLNSTCLNSIRLGACFIGLSVFAGPVFSAKQSEVSDTSVITDSLRATPWFDAEENRVRPVYLSPRDDDSVNRNSRWLPKPDAVKKPTQTQASTNAAGQGGGLFGTSVSFGNLLGWMLLLATAIGTVALIVYVVSRAEIGNLGGRSEARSEGKDKSLPDKQTLERIKHLPPELRRTDVNLRTECQRLMDLGRFDQAIILLLGHQLLLLDKNGLLRLGRGKTNGRYVRETRIKSEDCATWLRQTADAFEHSYFGRHEISADVFEQLWQQNAMIEQKASQFGVVQ